MLLFPVSSHDRTVKKYLKDILGIRPGNLTLYNIALTHRSASDSLLGMRINNERLEYLGDAVLDTIMAEYLFKKYPMKAEGELTVMRSKLVNREQLGKLSRKLHLDQIINIKTSANTKYVGGNALEALAGALFLDKGYEKSKDILLKRVFLAHIDFDAVTTEEFNFKSKIINWGQRNHKKITFNHTEINNKKEKLFKVSLLIDEKEVTNALDYTIKKAERTAAQRACESLNIE
ncbi:MAG: ribonuclease III [Bacteroidales bacterium]|nr:ribonuclease III [Bacteroidales bacterium]